MAETGDTTPLRVCATPPSEPQISDAVVEAAARSDATFDGRNYDKLCRADKERYCARARLSTAIAIAADRESSRAEIERLKAELKETRDHLGLEIIELRRERNEARAAAERHGADVEKLAVAAGKERSEVYRLTAERDAALAERSEVGEMLAKECAEHMAAIRQAAAERDAALSSTAIAEEALAKALASIPVAMDAAAEKERARSLEIVDELPAEFGEWLKENRDAINRPTLTSLLYDINLLPEQVMTFKSMKMMRYLVAVVEHFNMEFAAIRNRGDGK